MKNLKLIFSNIISYFRKKESIIWQLTKPYADY